MKITHSDTKPYKEVEIDAADMRIGETGICSKWFTLTGSNLGLPAYCKEDREGNWFCYFGSDGLGHSYHILNCIANRDGVKVKVRRRA